MPHQPSDWRLLERVNKQKRQCCQSKLLCNGPECGAKAGLSGGGFMRAPRQVALLPLQGDARKEAMVAEDALTPDNCRPSIQLVVTSAGGRLRIQKHPPPPLSTIATF